MSDSHLPIIIAGGGIGGLAAALALAKHGISSHVFEKRSDASEDGAGIQIGPNGVKALGLIGVRDHLKLFAATPDALVVHDGATASVLTRQPLGDWIAERHGASYWTLHRADLHGALLAAAKSSPLITLVNGLSVADYTNTADGIDVALIDGNTMRGHALIAADGLWSSLRPSVATSPAAKPFGKSAYRTVVPSNALVSGIETNAVHLWLAARTHAVMYPVRGCDEMALVIIADSLAGDTGWSQEADPTQVAAAAVPFAAQFRTVVQSARGWRTWAVHTLPTLSRWTDGNAALLGDAAHPILPFLAQGATMALEDAVVLAKSFARFGDDASGALHAYVSVRMARVARVAAAAERNVGIYHMTGVAAVARNMTLRMMPAGRLISSYDWLYGAEV
jgi:salicylate hydroxylase